MAVTINSVTKKVWRYLTKTAGMTEAGAAGMMGNLYAESGVMPVRLETLCKQRYRERLGKIYTDATYAAFVDDGTISRAEFLTPMGFRYGWGLAQWTTPSRKAGLYDLCKNKKVSIGDVETQLEWLLTELKTTYKSVYKTLTTTNSIRIASNDVLMKFEAPADTGMGVQDTRYIYSKQYYDVYAGTGQADTGQAAKASSGTTADDIIEIMRGWIGYSEANGKHKQIIDLYNSCRPLARGYAVQYYDAWCDTTVSAAFIKANAVDLIGSTECGVEEHIKIFRSKGIWIEDGTITPKAGDIICYNWDTGTQPNDGYADHIGIVEKVSGNQITVIEGNCDGAVKRRTIPVGWGYIRGYARPKYAATTQKAQEATKKAEPEKNAQASQKAADKAEKAAQAAQKPAASNGGALNKTEKFVGFVTADLLNVRSWAGTENPNIRTWPQLAYSNLVSVCDTVKAKDGTDWYYIYIQPGDCYGFVSAQWVKKM